MDDADFEAALAAAFQAPAADVARRDMTEAILQRARKTSWARAGVLAGSGLVGVAIAGSVLVATQLAQPIAYWAAGVIRDLRVDTYSADASPFDTVRSCTATTTPASGCRTSPLPRGPRAPSWPPS